MTSVPGMFAGVHVVRGTNPLVHVVPNGRKAAEGIHRYLSGQGDDYRARCSTGSTMMSWASCALMARRVLQT